MKSFGKLSKYETHFKSLSLTFLAWPVAADIVFLRSWYPVAVPQLYNPVTSLLMPVGQKDCWMGMRTLGQLKKDLNIHNMPNKDSIYKVKWPWQAKTTHEEMRNVFWNPLLILAVSIWPLKIIYNFFFPIKKTNNL